MAVGFDGSINIDTRVDSKGINKGTKEISSSLGGVLNAVKKVGSVLALVFAGTTLTRLVRSALDGFDLMSSSIGSNVAQLDTAFQTLNGTFVNLIVTAIAPLIPYVVMLVNWLTSLLSTVTQVVAALFGMNQTVGSIASKSKAATGGLASFDKLNVLKKGDAGGQTTPPPMLISPELLAKVEEFKQKMLDLLKPLFDAFERIKNNPIWQTIGDGLKWVWDNILVPFAEWVISVLAPALVDLFGARLNVLNAALKAFAPSAQSFFDDFLKPLASWAATKFIEFLEWLTKKLNELAQWIAKNPEKFRQYATILGVLIIAFFTLGTVVEVVGFILGALAIAFDTTIIIVGLVLIAIVALIAGLIWLYKNWDLVKQKAGEVWDAIKAKWAEAGVWFMTTVGQPIQNIFNAVFAYVHGLFLIFISNILDGLNLMRAIFDNALNWIADKFTNVFSSIQNFVLGVIGNIIGSINAILSTVESVLGLVAGLGNTTGGYVYPGTAGSTSGSGTRLPRMASGGVIPPNAQFAAILGDQTSGKNIEAPADLIKQMVMEGIAASGGQAITITFGGSLGELVRLLKPQIDRETTRLGGSFRKGDPNGF
jgi:hypothetical protein